MEEVKKTILAGKTAREIGDFVRSLGFEPYRGRQISLWIYRKGAAKFENMSDLPKELRAKLAEVAEIYPFKVLEERRSSDGTTKFLLELEDGEKVECVWLPHRDWETICVSTQVGCPIGCKFCASGRDFVRNLSAAEIVGQVLLARISESTNVVFMGIGEPLLNRKELFRALEILNKEARIGARRMTVSTVGIADGILELANLGMQVNLAISLHAPNEELRRSLIPAAVSPIHKIMNACKEYYFKTKRRISFEYVLLKGINSEPKHAFRLAKLLRACDFDCHVNLIPYNQAVEGFERPSPEEVERFREILDLNGIKATVRGEKGADIEAACGQLRHRRKAERR